MLITRLILCLSFLTFFSLRADFDVNQPGTVVFTPPPGWHFADKKELSPRVKVMVIGKGLKEFPPSINLTTEEYKGSLKDYLKIVKEINASKRGQWKKLGTINTAAGKASLSQLDTPSQWGDLRMLHAILLSNETIYILTAAALAEEFPKFHKDFFAALKSLRINPEVAENDHKELD
jgi:hypothetical protein